MLRQQLSSQFASEVRRLRTELKRAWGDCYHALRERVEMEVAMKVKTAMHRGVEWCDPETPVCEIAKIMLDHDIGAVPIGEDDKLVGMVTDRDIVCKAVAKGSDLAKTTARDVMTPGIIYCRETEDVAEAVHRMEIKGVRRMPVINKNKRMVGMLSLGDVSHSAPLEMSGEVTKALSAHH